MSHPSRSRRQRLRDDVDALLHLSEVVHSFLRLADEDRHDEAWEMLRQIMVANEDHCERCAELARAEVQRQADEVIAAAERRARIREASRPFSESHDDV